VGSLLVLSYQPRQFRCSVTTHVSAVDLYISYYHIVDVEGRCRTRKSGFARGIAQRKDDLFGIPIHCPTSRGSRCLSEILSTLSVFLSQFTCFYSFLGDTRKELVERTVQIYYPQHSSPLREKESDRSK